jgi:hypothetical protein
MLRAATDMFIVDDPADGSMLEAGLPHVLKGHYVGELPDGYESVVGPYDGWGYYPPDRKPGVSEDREWSLKIVPGPATWKYHLCLANRKGSERLDDEVAAGTFPSGQRNHDCKFPALPDGVTSISSVTYDVEEPAH